MVVGGAPVRGRGEGETTDCSSSKEGGSLPTCQPLLSPVRPLCHTSTIGCKINIKSDVVIWSRYDRTFSSLVKTSSRPAPQLDVSQTEDSEL